MMISVQKEPDTGLIHRLIVYPRVEFIFSRPVRLKAGIFSRTIP